MSASPRLIGLLALTVLVGCLSIPELPSEDGGTGEDREESADNIEIQVGSSSGIYGGPTSSARWVLQRTGECRGTITHGSNAGSQPTTEEVEFRSEETYRECRQLLRETGFFWMRDRVPKFQFESSTTSIEARIGIHRHDVRVVSPERSPPEFVRITDFVHGLEERAKGAKQ
ncbi:MAG: hypothetical protein L0241_25410 [Planctomycetia bacterium]|nr:hypothetical protein [Planctomycetia bacterium]